MSDTIFGKIISGEIPADFLYEDEIAIALKDINPRAKTHLLIIPKKPIASIIELEEGDEKIVGHLVRVAKQLAEERKLPGYKLQINVGKEGGQEIFHLHLHLLSDYSNDIR